MVSVNLTYKFADGQQVDLEVSGTWIDSFPGSNTEPAYDGYFDDYSINMQVVDFDGTKRFLEVSFIFESSIVNDILERAEEQIR